MQNQPPQPAELAEIEALLEAAEWRFAKTMPENPHEYTLRKTWGDEGAFARVVEFIRAHGETERYPPGSRNRYKVLVLGGHKFWTMGWPVDKTILINRKPVEMTT